MNSSPLVTIGIPVYNCERYIRQSIMSVLKQSYTNFELIITDDGSTDNTVLEIKKFRDSRIHLIVDGENRGISYRLNQQIDVAKGEFFVRMDGDDLMFPYRIEKQINYLLKNPDVDVVGASAVVIDDDNSILGLRKSGNEFHSVRDVVFRSRYIHPTVTGRIEWFKKYRYKEEYNGSEDRNLWIRSFNDSTMYCLDEPLMFYRDAMNFKLKTYLFRMKQGRIMRMGERHIIGNALAIEYVIRNYIKTVIVYFVAKIGMGKIVVIKRNCLLTPSSVATYSAVINSIINEDNSYC